MDVAEKHFQSGKQQEPDPNRKKQTGAAGKMLLSYFGCGVRCRRRNLRWFARAGRGFRLFALSEKIHRRTTSNESPKTVGTTVKNNPSVLMMLPAANRL